MRGPSWDSMVRASRDEALLAVELHNRPDAPRSFEAFIVHMHLAWLYLLQARCARDGVTYHYFREVGRVRRYDYVDGERKCWDLAKHARERWDESANAVRANLEFFIGLRNKIEHRFERHQEALSLATAAHAHALLINFDAELTTEFGQEWSLATRLRFPIFVGSFSDDGEAALRTLRATLPPPLRRYIANFESGLSNDVLNDERFQFRLQLISVTGTATSDALPLQFVRWNDLTSEQQKSMEEAGRHGTVVVRNRLQAVANHGRLKPRQASRAVATRIPFVFNLHHFRLAYLKLNVRPPGNAHHPEVTNTDYCIYDEAHGDYTYEERYVELLVRKCSTAEGFVELTGRPAVPKPSSEASGAGAA